MGGGRDLDISIDPAEEYFRGIAESKLEEKIKKGMEFQNDSDIRYRDRRNEPANSSAYPDCGSFGYPIF